MGFKKGDRVHVKRFGGLDADFRANLGEVNGLTTKLTNCSEKAIEGSIVYSHNSSSFGYDKSDYYTLCTKDQNRNESMIENINRLYEQAPTKEQLLAFAKDKNIDSDPVIDDASATRHYKRQRDQYKEERDLLMQYINLINNTDCDFEKFMAHNTLIRIIKNNK